MANENSATSAPTRTENDVLAALAAKAYQMPLRDEVANTPILRLADGRTISLEPYLPHPLRKRASVKLTEPTSFCAYVAAHQEPGTHLFGDVSTTSGHFAAIMDYHLPESADCQGDNGAMWGNHNVLLALQTTVEWDRWIKGNGQPMAQAVFAEFLEDNALDIIRPSGAELLEVALTLQAAKSVSFRSAVRLQNGQNQLRYEENIDGRAGPSGNLEVPERFTLLIAPFVGTDPVEMEARLRYRINDGKLVFFYTLLRPDYVVRQVWQTIRDRICKETLLPVLRGGASILDPKS